MTTKPDVAGGAIMSGGKLTPFLADAGPKGDGAAGQDGLNGWTPILAGEADGTRTLIKVADWAGGEGTKPATGIYIGTTGYVSTKAAAFNFNAAKRVITASGVTNAQGVAAIDYSAMAFAAAPMVVPLPATTPALSGPTRSAVSAITKNGCTVTVQQQAILTGLLSFLVGATANVLVIET